jgi:hypothetical protein
VLDRGLRQRQNLKASVLCVTESLQRSPPLKARQRQSFGLTPVAEPADIDRSPLLQPSCSEVARFLSKSPSLARRIQ